MKKRVLLKATVTALGVAGGICRAMVLSHVDSRGLVVDAPLLNGLTFGAALLVLALTLMFGLVYRSFPAPPPSSPQAIWTTS